MGNTLVQIIFESWPTFIISFNIFSFLEILQPYYKGEILSLKDTNFRKSI